MCRRSRGQERAALSKARAHPRVPGPAWGCQEPREWKGQVHAPGLISAGTWFSACQGLVTGFKSRASVVYGVTAGVGLGIRTPGFSPPAGLRLSKCHVSTHARGRLFPRRASCLRRRAAPTAEILPAQAGADSGPAAPERQRLVGRGSRGPANAPQLLRQPPAVQRKGCSRPLPKAAPWGWDLIKRRDLFLSNKEFI